jgi:hypothetical protein
VRVCLFGIEHERVVKALRSQAARRTSSVVCVCVCYVCVCVFVSM